MNSNIVVVGIGIIGLIIWLILNGTEPFFIDYMNNTWKVKLNNILAKSLCVLLLIELIILLFEIIDFFITT